MKTLIVVVLMLSIVTLTSCFKNCTDTSYSFNINAQVYPDNDSIHIGDTLWLEVNTPTTIVDNISSKTVDYTGAENMSISVTLASLHAASDTDAGTSYATDEFDYVLRNGSLFTSDQYAKNYLYDEVNNTYIFKLAIVPKQKGVYRLDISDAVDVYRKKHKCDRATFNMSIVDSNQHFELYQTVGPDIQPDVFALHHYYIFKVY